MKSMTRPRLLTVAALLLLAVCAALLMHLKGGGVIATLVSASPGAARDFRGSEEHWVSVAPGDAMRIGDAVRTPQAGQAVLSLEDGATMALDPDTVVRFLERAPAHGQFRVERGLAGLSTGDVGIQIETALGVFELSPRSTVRIEHASNATHLRVDMGRASLIDPDHAPQSMSPGDELFLEGNSPPRLLQAGDVNTRPGDSPVASPLLAAAETIDAEREASSRDPDAGAGEEETAGRKLSLPPQPTRADVSVRAGEQATVHDPGQATNVRLSFLHVCPKGDAIVDVSSLRGQFAPRASSAGTAVIRVATGASRYRVRCPGPTGALRIVASGQIRVVRDAAIRRVPMRPPTNEVDLDGRRYTVLYQNRLPIVVAHAPAKMRVGRMVVRSGSRLRTVDAPGGVATFASGELADGVHSIFFESPDGQARSAVTTLSISFDNAAPMASIDQRGDVLPDGAGQVHLSGVVPLGSRVSLAGQSLSLDAGGRFEAKALPKDTDTAVSLRVEHPRAGLHYYVRHIEGAGEAP